MESEIQKRIFGYDLIKALAIFLVVLYHFKSVDFGQVPESGWYIPNVPKFLYAICSAGVPLFFMVNGALQGEKRISARKCLEKSGRLLFVAVFWTVFFTCILSPLILGRKLPTIGDFQNYYWFLYTLAGLYWMNFLLNKSKWIKMVSVVALIIFPFISNLIWDVVLFFDSGKVLPSWGHTGVFTLYSIVYYYLGVFFAKKEISQYISLLLVMIGLLLVNGEVVVMSSYYHKVYDGVNACFPTVGAMMISTGLFLLFKSAKGHKLRFLSKGLSAVGRNTIGVYVFHLFIVILTRNFVFLNEKQNPVVVFFLTLCVVVFLTFIAEVLNRSKLKFLLKV